MMSISVFTYLLSYTSDGCHIKNGSIVPKIFQLFEKRCLLITLNNEIVLQIVDDDSFIVMFYHHNVLPFKLLLAYRLHFSQHAKIS